MTQEKLFLFYNLQPANNSCPDDPLGPGRFVVGDPTYPLEDQLYATLLLNASAEVTLTSGTAAPRTFSLAPGVVSVQVPRLPGAQRVRVIRAGAVLADTTGSELANSSTSADVRARCDHRTFTASEGW